MPRLKLPSTLSVLMALSACAAIWEMYTLANRTNGDTFSATIRRLGQNQPFIVLGCGLVCGHIFWPLLDKEDIESPHESPTPENRTRPERVPEPQR